MDINKNCKLFLRNIYSYDISACHYNILKSLNFDISTIEKNNKITRNIQIGKLMKDNQKLSSILRTTTEALIDGYILINKLKPENIIVRQYDGFMSNKPLKETTTQYLPIDFKSIFSHFIISLDRTKFIAADDKEIIIKGVSHRYKEVDEIYKKILLINYANKNAVFSSLYEIKNEILNSTESRLYCVPSGENKYNVFLKQYGQFEISETVINILDTDDIDKQRYFEFYFQSFFDSIAIEFL